MTSQQQASIETITLEGDLTLPHATELKDSLAGAIGRSTTVQVQFGAVGEVDLSCLQLLCSAHRSATSQQKEFRLAAGLPPVLLATAAAAGYARNASCKFNIATSCIWSEATQPGQR